MAETDAAFQQAMPTDPLAALKAQFAAQAQDNPGLAMLFQLMEQRLPAGAEADPRDGRRVGADADVIDVEATSATEPPALDERLRADLQALVHASTQLSAERDALQQRNDALAAALGACHLCFGRDAWCPHCGGRGAPGSTRPEPRAFDHYVRPLLQRLQRRSAAAHSHAAPRREAPVPPGSAEGLRARVP